MALLDLGGQSVRTALLIERSAILQGELWRVVTAHFVNLSSIHTYLNVLGLGLILVTLWPIITPMSFFRAVILSGATIGIGWLLLMPNGITYVGFSGVTHGVMAWGGLVLWRTGPRWFACLVIGCLLAKLGHEFWIGAVPGADAAIGGRVSFVSHSLGSLGGALAACGTSAYLRIGLIALFACLSLVQSERETLQLMVPLQDG